MGTPKVAAGWDPYEVWHTRVRRPLADSQPQQQHRAQRNILGRQEQQAAQEGTAGATTSIERSLPLVDRVVRV
jgi:hypothetical protein